MNTCKSCKNEIPDGSIYCNWCGVRQVRERRKAGAIRVPKARQLPSGRWNIQLRRERCSITEDTEALANARAVAVRAGFLQQQKQTQAEGITLGQAVDRYIDDHTNLLSPSTVKAYRATRRNRFLELMATPLSRITPHMVQSAVNREAAASCAASGRDGVRKNDHTVSGKTVANAYGLVRRVLTLETDLDLTRIQLPRCGMEGGQTLEPEQIGRLIRAVRGDSVELPVLLSVWLGLRRSEIAALTRADFDFERRTVRVHAALVQDESNQWIEKGTKTRSSTRTLDCPDYILSRVRALPEGRILQVHPNYLYIKLQRICRREGLPQVRFHDLRHSAASVMLLLGVPDKYAMERGGWTTKKTMTGRYQHTIDAEARHFSEQINSYYLDLITNEPANAGKVHINI